MWQDIFCSIVYNKEQKERDCMKKCLLVVIMVMMLVSPAMGANTIFIDDAAYYADTIVQDNRIFVPLRFVGEAMGYKVEWKDGMVIMATATDLARPKIIGDETFVNAINDALDLLRDKSPADHELVCRNIQDIQITEDTNKSAFMLGRNVRISSYLISINDGYKNAYIAAVLTHEALHAVNNKYGMDIKEQENQSYLREMNVLRILEVPQQQIDNIERTRQRILNQL